MPVTSWTPASALIERLLAPNVSAEQLPGLAAACFELSRAAGCPCPSIFVISGSLLMEATRGLEDADLTSLQEQAVPSLTGTIAASVELGCMKGDQAPWSGLEAVWSELRQTIIAH